MRDRLAASLFTAITAARAAHATSLTIMALAIAAAFLGGHAITAQAPAASRPWTAPKTEWGDSDLQGIWNYATMTPVERAANFATKAVLTEEEAMAFEEQTNARQRTANTFTAGPDWFDPGTQRLVDRRTSLVVDPPTGRIPPTTAEARARAAAERRERGGAADGPESLGLNVRCLQQTTAGPPMLPGLYNNNVQLVQTKQHIAIYNEMIHDVRVVPMDGRPHGTLRQWMGDSRGHWDGATLVVDTVNFSEKNPFRGSAEHLHLIERFTRTNADTIAYRFTVDDPTVWTAAWTVEFPMHLQAGPIYEYACHEGNALSMEGILKNARYEEAHPPAK